MADIETCFFPILDGGANPVTMWQSTNISLHDAVDLRDFCERLGISSLNVLQMVWALVLRCYVGSNSLSFGCMGLEKPVLGMPLKNGFDETSHLNSLFVELQDENTVLKTLKGISEHTFKGPNNSEGFS